MFLREIDIFRDLTPDHVQWLETTTRMATVGKGQISYQQTDMVAGLFLLKQGWARLSRMSVGGKKLNLAILEPGAFFGEMPLLGERMRSATAEAVEASVLCALRQHDIEQLILRQPAQERRTMMDEQEQSTEEVHEWRVVLVGDLPSSESSRSDHSAQQESLAGSLYREMATILSASAIVG